MKVTVKTLGRFVFVTRTICTWIPIGTGGVRVAAGNDNSSSNFMLYGVLTGAWYFQNHFKSRQVTRYTAQHTSSGNVSEIIPNVCAPKASKFYA
eukprot:371602-Rhodomonas_salina.1